MNYHHQSGGGMSGLSHSRDTRSQSELLPSHQSPNVDPNIRGGTLRLSSDRSAENRVASSSTNARRNQQQQQPIYRNTPSVMSPQMSTPSHLQDTAPIYARMSTGTRRQDTTPSTDKQQQPTHSAKISVADSMIGAILGKRGQTLNELQSKSRTKIRISQRGEFIPGTNDRIVTITGPSDESVTSAKSLIRQYLSRNTHERMVSPSEHES